MTHALEWPSLTVQWIPDTSISRTENALHKLVLGTHTSNGEQNYLMIASIKLPQLETGIEGKSKAHHAKKNGTHGKMEINIKINHRGEVNRARYMPQNPFVLATKSPSSDVYVFDISKHPSIPKDGSFCPEHRCLGHTKEGYGLCWNPHTAGQLLSGSDDCSICCWDINQSCIDVTATTIWKGHVDVVEDVSWHVQSPHVFGSVGDDRQILLWDTRRAKDPFIRVAAAHYADINAIAFNPHHEFLLATGSADQVVKVWDIRNTSKALHHLKSHDKEVFQLQWAPFDASILASCGADRRVRVWDLTRIGVEQCVPDVVDGPSELLFVHGGHNEKVSDLSWNPQDRWVVASVSDDNILQIWKMGANIHHGYD